MDTITLYSNQALTTLIRTFDVGALSEPSDELTDRYEYIVSRQEFLDAYNNWNHDEHPLLRVRDQLSQTYLYLGRPSARRIEEAIQKKQASVQLF